MIRHLDALVSRRALTLTLCATPAMAFLSLVIAYPSISDAARFVVYVGAFNLLPGAIALRVFFPNILDVGIASTYALVLGILTNLVVFIGLWLLGRTELLWLLPVAACVALLFAPRVPGMFARLTMQHRFIGSIATAAVLFVTGLLGVAYMLAFMTSATNDPLSFHSAFQGVIVRALQRGWPPPNLMAPGVPLSYNYGAHLWLLGAVDAVGLPIDVLVTRYGPLFFGIAAAAMLYAFGRRYVGLGARSALLPVFATFWIFGIPPVSGAIFGTFMPSGAYLILSPFLSFLAFFLIFSLVLEERPVPPALRLTFIVVGTFLATGARGVCPPILICALVVRWIAACNRRRTFVAAPLADVIAAAGGFAVGLRFFFTVGSNFSGTGFLQFTGQPFTSLLIPGALFTMPSTLVHAGIPPLASAAIAFALIAFFQAAFLSPAALQKLMHLRHAATEAEIMLAGAGFAGVAAVFVTTAPGYSHLSFLYFSGLSFSLLGASQLQQILRTRPWQTTPNRLTGLVLTCTALLAVLQVVEFPVPIVTSLVNVAGATTQRLHTCDRPQDGELFGRARAIDPHAVVIIVLPQLGLCEQEWWIEQSATPAVTQYALENLPGKASNAFQALLMERKAHLDHAISRVDFGKFSIPDVVAIAHTLGERSIFVITVSGLRFTPNPNMREIASNDRVTLWRESEPATPPNASSMR